MEPHLQVMLTVAAIIAGALVIALLREIWPQREDIPQRVQTPAPPLPAAEDEPPHVEVPIQVEAEITYPSPDTGLPERRQISGKRLHVRQTPGRVPVFTLEAYCHARRAPRRFRCDRIAELVDAETGEIVTGPANIVGWLTDRAMGKHG